MQHLHLTHPRLDFWVTVEIHERDGRYMATADLAEDSRDVGESVETVSAFLDHSSLAVTTTYLRRLEGVEDHSWERVAVAIGVSRAEPRRETDGACVATL